MSRKKQRKKDKAEPAPLEERYICDKEVELWQAVERRMKAPDGPPDGPTHLAMEEPVLRLMRASMLFYDLATAVDGSPVHDARDIQTMGLVFLSQAMLREAERVYTLYRGQPPCYG